MYCNTRVAAQTYTSGRVPECVALYAMLHKPECSIAPRSSGLRRTSAGYLSFQQDPIAERPDTMTAVYGLRYWL